MNKKKSRKILVTGGAGYIGSHCVVSLIEKGFKPIIIDNFSNSYPDVIKKIELITKKITIKKKNINKFLSYLIFE